MLLILSANAVCAPAPTKGDALPLLDAPAYAGGELGVRGLAVQTSLLRGVDGSYLDSLRDRGDKNACPILMLEETDPHPLADDDPNIVDRSHERLERVVRVAHRLGCSSVAMAVDAGVDADIEDVAASLKDVVRAAERFELNVLLTPARGLTALPESLTQLIRKVGGFRIGSHPSFDVAAASGDCTGYLRSVSPFASIIGVASHVEGDSRQVYDLKTCMKAIRSVGYDATLALEPPRGGKIPAFDAVVATKARIEALLGTET